MRVIALSFVLIFSIVPVVLPQSSDEPPKMRRRAKPDSEFKVSYAEGSLFQRETTTVSGRLKFFHCATVPRLVIAGEGKEITLEITDPAAVEVKGGKSKTLDFGCGKQPPRPVTVEYYERKGVKVLHSIAMHEGAGDDATRR